MASYSGAVPDDPATRRRRAVVAGHQGDEPTARAAADDPDGRVRAAGLSSLARLQRLGPDDLRTALADPDPVVRRRAAGLAAGAGRGPGRRSVRAQLRRSLADPDPLVVDAACFALGELGGSSAVADLSTVAVSHADPRCREAAVAALGSLGDPDGLTAVLAALADGPAVRRRATVALAAFAGPEVEAALGRCLEDRDWQVRQAAEILLDN
jgi:HEAT repeat protein